VPGTEHGGQAAIEHGSSSAGRWLHANRFKLVLLLVIIEALFVAFGSLSLWLAVVVAGCLLALYLLFRNELSGSARELAWIVASSQAFGVLVFALVLVTVLLVVAAVVVLALAVLAALLVDRH
jgi:hypothetical protein